MTDKHFLAMKAAAIWEEMRSFASNRGLLLTAGWNYLWGFKKRCLLPSFSRDSDLTDMRLQHWGLQSSPGDFTNHKPLPCLSYKDSIWTRKRVNKSGDSVGAGVCTSVSRV